MGIKFDNEKQIISNSTYSLDIFWPADIFSSYYEMMSKFFNTRYIC